MKKLSILVSSLFILLAAKAQTDTVCYQSNSANYQVANVPGNTYTWSVAAPGVIASGQGTNQITVNWGTANPGLITGAVSVFATNAEGCPGPPVTLDVFVFNVVPTVSPLTLCINAPCTTMSGSPVGGTWSGVGVSNDQFCPNIAGVGTSTVTYTYTEAGCTFTATQTMTVNPLPTVSPIQHD